jgi:hypothetical protein
MYLSLCCQNEIDGSNKIQNIIKIFFMKTTVNFLSQISNHEMEALLTEVKETLAPAAINHKVKFCAADLWKIQRMRRARSLRREIAY